MPDFIRFCNSIEASVYVSYLDSPLEFAISELPREHLKLILDELSQAVVPQTTPLETRNARCLKDFLTYVSRYVQRGDEPQYSDYQPLDSPVNSDVVVVQREATREELLSDFQVHLAKHRNAQGMTAEMLMQRIDAVYSGVDASFRPILFGMVLQSNFADTYRTLTSQSVEELRARVEQQLPKIRLKGSK